jgi:hypothetical protein
VLAGDRRGPIGRVGIDDEELVEQPGGAQRRDPIEDRADRRRAFAATVVTFAASRASSEKAAPS